MWDYTHLSFFFALHQDNLRLLKYFCLLTITAANRRGRTHRVELKEVLLYKSITQNNNKSFCFSHPTLKKINLQLRPLVISPSASCQQVLNFLWYESSNTMYPDVSCHNTDGRPAVKERREKKLWQNEVFSILLIHTSNTSEFIDKPKKGLLSCINALSST